MVRGEIVLLSPGLLPTRFLTFIPYHSHWLLVR
jgi:hypothetical protein